MHCKMCVYMVILLLPLHRCVYRGMFDKGSMVKDIESFIITIDFKNTVVMVTRIMLSMYNCV